MNAALEIYLHELEDKKRDAVANKLYLEAEKIQREITLALSATKPLRNVYDDEKLGGSLRYCSPGRLRREPDSCQRVAATLGLADAEEIPFIKYRSFFDLNLNFLSSCTDP